MVFEEEETLFEETLVSFFPLTPPTVGQDVDELICQSERKMQQNATFYL